LKGNSFQERLRSSRQLSAKVSAIKLELVGS